MCARRVSKGLTFVAVKSVFRKLGLAHFLSAFLSVVFGLLAFGNVDVGFVFGFVSWVRPY